MLSAPALLVGMVVLYVISVYGIDYMCSFDDHYCP